MTAPTDEIQARDDADAAGVRIEDVRAVARLEELEELQVRVWGFEPRHIVPAHVLYIAGSTGGIVLGAYIDEQLVGFALGFLAWTERRPYHASHIVGVDPAYQGRNIGAALKWRQRERALAQGLDLMTWTFDPLEARNAYFNLHKLGAISHTYHENLYGALTDQLNRDLPTDRLLIQWHLRAPAPKRSGTPGQTPIPILRERDGVPVLDLRVEPGEAPLTVSVPPDMQRLKREEPRAALAWRLAVRQALSWALGRGYTIVDFRDGAYVLIGPDPGRSGLVD